MTSKLYMQFVINPSIISRCHNLHAMLDIVQGVHITAGFKQCHGCGCQRSLGPTSQLFLQTVPCCPAPAQLAAAAARPQTGRLQTAASSRPAAAAQAVGIHSTISIPPRHICFPCALVDKRLLQAATRQHSGQRIAAQGICIHLEAHARLLRLLHDVERPAACF